MRGLGHLPQCLDLTPGPRGSCGGLKDLLEALAHPLVVGAVEAVGPAVWLVTVVTRWLGELPNLAESFVVNMEAPHPPEEP